MSSSETLYWHDYETFGVNPAYDRPVQFAGLRTDLDFNPLGDPLVLFARPPVDYLPQPGACLVTGITPQQAQEHGVSEAEFIAAIDAQFSVPGTCALGYNSLRFDDTVTRFTLYRNLRDPYAREYGSGRSRWDLIDALRTAYALRPEGINWPQRSDGLPSFRLEDLSAANGVEHGQAHDALADVQASIAMAKLLKTRQPKLYEWLRNQRTKQAIQQMINVDSLQPLLHVSGMFGAARANLGLILPLAWHTQNSNELICADLSSDPQPLLDLPAETLRTLLYTPGAEMPEGVERPGIKSVHINRCPVLLPPKMADEAVAARSGLDLARCRLHLQQLRQHQDRSPGALRDKVREVMAAAGTDRSKDPDLMLYSGGFFSRGDRATLDRLLALSSEALGEARVAFDDARLEEMLFRYRARNFPDSLDAEESQRWAEFCYSRLTDAEPPALGIEEFQQEIDGRLASETLSDRDRGILEALLEWGDELLA